MPLSSSSPTRHGWPCSATPVGRAHLIVTLAHSVNSAHSHTLPSARSARASTCNTASSSTLRLCLLATGFSSSSARMGLRTTHLLACVALLAVLSSVQTAAAADAPSLVARLLTQENLERFKFELLGLAAIIAYILAAVRGTAKNKRVAESWLRVLGGPDGVLARNFAVHGGLGGGEQQDALWWKESAACYKAYASGRRYCSGALLTLDLQPRHDVFSQLWHLVSPKEDSLLLEVFMAEAGMPQTVLLLGQPRIVKAMLREEPRIGNFAKLLQVPRERVPGAWPLDRVSVAAEHGALFYDLLSAEPGLARGLGAPCLRSGLASSEADPKAAPPGPRLTFRIGLPANGDAEDVNAALSCVFLLVDLLGSYKAPPEMRKRAVELRARLEQEAAKKGAQDRQEVLAQKRLDRLEAERAKARAAGPAALAKFEERQQAKQRQREMRKRTIRA